MSPGPFGHEGMAHRAHILLWEHQAFNRLANHVRSVDVAGFDRAGTLTTLAEVEELCLQTEGSGDVEILKIVGPFFAFRGLVLANLVWYPDVCDTVRRRICAFMAAVLENDAFDPALVNAYCGE
jgi:hypothetical protein